MSRLKRRKSDDWQKCCKYCHYFKNGSCTNQEGIYLDDEEPIYSVSEEGVLEDVIVETLGSVRLKEFEPLEMLLRDYRLSEKRINEFKTLFKDCWEKFVDQTLTNKLENSVSYCYENYYSGNYEFRISNPEEYCCDKWC